MTPYYREIGQMKNGNKIAPRRHFKDQTYTTSVAVLPHRLGQVQVVGTQAWVGQIRCEDFRE